MSSTASLRAEIARIAAAAGRVEQRADALLGSLGKVIPYDAGWIAVRDPETRTHRRVGSDGDTDALARYFALPEADEELEALGMNRFQPPVPASALPVPLAETRAWGEYLLPAGFNDGVAMALFTDDGRHLGFLSVLTSDSRHRPASYIGLLAGLRPLLARALDRLPSFAAAAQLTGDAVGGTAITRAGRCVDIPGLPTHPLLVEGSATLSLARRAARAPGTISRFLSPWARGFARVSVLDCRDETVDHLSALALIRPAGDASQLGLTDLRASTYLPSCGGETRGSASPCLASLSRPPPDTGFDHPGRYRHVCRYPPGTPAACNGEGRPESGPTGAVMP